MLSNKKQNIALCLLVIALQLFAIKAVADQNNPRLPILYENLKADNTIVSHTEVDRQIREIWSDSGDEKVNKKFMLGIQYLEGNDPFNALIIFNEITKQMPNFAEAHNKLSFCYFVIGSLQEAKDEIDITISLVPQHNKAYYGKGFIEMRLSNYPEALKSFRKAKELYPKIDPDIDQYIKKVEDLVIAIPSV